jgi:hypothetical protein
METAGRGRGRAYSRARECRSEAEALERAALKIGSSEVIQTSKIGLIESKWFLTSSTTRSKLDKYFNTLYNRRTEIRGVLYEAEMPPLRRHWPYRDPAQFSDDSLESSKDVHRL